MENREHLALYSENCIKCKHLVTTAEKCYNKCHFSKGNSFCPAAELQIVVVGKAARWAKLVKEAREKRDILTEYKILSKVKDEPKPFVERFYHYLENGITQ